MFDPAGAVETFQLALLRVLETGKERSRWVVKGGVNLRAWFGSPRRSEDLDLDALSWPRGALAERLDAVFASQVLATLLDSRGLRIVRTSKSKQTDTTQRWKVALASPSTVAPVHTRIEFSHRGSGESFALEPVRPEIARPHGIPAPTANHYVAAAAARQKIVALGLRRVAQARDVFDLDHLFRVAAAKPRPLGRAERAALHAALDRAMEMSFDEYRAQVVPFLVPEQQPVFGTRDAWERMQELVVDHLTEIGR